MLARASGIQRHFSQRFRGDSSGIEAVAEWGSYIRGLGVQVSKSNDRYAAPIGATGVRAPSHSHMAVTLFFFNFFFAAVFTSFRVMGVARQHKPYCRIDELDILAAAQACVAICLSELSSVVSSMGSWPKDVYSMP